MNYSGARVLITGGLGFIGSNLARRLVGQGAQVSVIDNLEPKFGGNVFNVHDIEKRISIRIADIRDREEMERQLDGVDFLFNLAAQTSHLDSMTDPSTDFAINATAQLDLLEICRRTNRGVRIVYTSTRQIYGRPDYLPVDEDHPDRPVDVNGISKLAGEQFHRLYDSAYGISSCTLRLTNTYGPGMRVKDARQTFLGIWVRRLLESRPIAIFGDGTQLRDFTYVDDCVDALLAAGAIDAARGELFNVGSPEAISLKDLAELMIGLGFGGQYELVPFPPDRQVIDIGDFSTNTDKIRRMLGYEQHRSLQHGLSETLDYYSRHLGKYI
jgi:UDP-glucose 4-epimerase